MALHDLLVPSFAEVGKIKIGCKAPPREGKTHRLPQKLDHFVITTLTRDRNDDLMQDVQLMESLKEYRSQDGKLRSIPVMFASNDITQVMTTNYTWYNGRKMGAKSDGRTLEWRLDPQTGEPRKDGPYTEPWDPDKWLKATYKNGPMFKLSTRMNVMIASPAARFGGFYAFRTTSVISANQLYGSLLMLRRFTGGVLRGLPFRMVVRPLIVTPNGITSTVYVVHVEYMNSDLLALQGAAKQQAQFELENSTAVAETEKQYKMLLATTGEEPLDEDEEDLDNAPLALPPASPPPPPAPPVLSVADRTRNEVAETLRDMTELSTFHAFWKSETFAKEMWAKLDKEGKAEITKFGHETATRLKKPAEAPPPAGADAGTEPETPKEETGPPPVEGDGPAEPQESEKPAAGKAGKNIVATIEKKCVEVGVSWADFREKHNIEAARVKDLTAADAIKVLKLLTPPEEAQ